MDIKNVNIIRSQLSQTVSHRDVHTLRARPREIALHGFLLAIVRTISSAKFSRDNHLVARPSLLHPFPNQFLRLLGIIRVGRVDEVPT